uniref:Putative nucleocapsid protein n=1 Tax=Emaravirus cajani TaxID=1980429 RepID=A0A219T3S1_9VIRU|nr:putative nucleocapsid protein [Emaravirus cajani]
MPPKMPSKTPLSNMPAASKKSDIPDNEVRINVKGKVNTIKFPNVKDKKLQNTEGTSLKPATIEPKAFKSAAMVEHDFKIKKYISYCNINAAAAYLSQSKEHKEMLKQNDSLILTVSKDQKIYVIQNIQETNIENVLSFNKACAVLALGILKHKFPEIFDWTSHKYVTSGWSDQNLNVEDTIINRLAGAMGLTPDNPYYWFMVPGYEFLYELYPAECIAYTLLRVEYREVLNIPEKISNQDIVQSLTVKMNKFHGLETSTFKDAVAVVGLENIKAAYQAMSSSVGETGRTRRAAIVLAGFEELLKSLKE